jgi:hypothetical protein
MHTRQNPSERYIVLLKQYKHMHNDSYTKKRPFLGRSLRWHIDRIADIIKETESKTILDYGSGRGILYEDGSIQKKWGIKKIHLYDPAYKPYSKLPDHSFDGVVCTDVLEHCPKEDLDWIISEIVGFANKFVYFHISCRLAGKSLPNGENAHCTVKSIDWWTKLIDSKNDKKIKIHTFWLDEDKDAKDNSNE